MRRIGSSFLFAAVAWLALFCAAGPCRAWDTAPHRKITRAALEALPARFVNRLGGEATPLVEIYCIYPDRYEEMESFGFVRKSAGPRDIAEIRPYCVRPDGQTVHGATGDREKDTGSLVYLLERMLTNLARSRPGEVARYAGVLSHFVADSLSPPHAVNADELLEMTPAPAREERINIHAAIERSLPEFTLGKRAPRLLGTHLVPAAEAILAECYAGAGRNAADLPLMVKAASARDEKTLNEYRLRAGTRAAEILADALFTLFTMGEEVR
jgi:hypothetical protein